MLNFFPKKVNLKLSAKNCYMCLKEFKISYFLIAKSWKHVQFNVILKFDKKFLTHMENCSWNANILSIVYRVEDKSKSNVENALFFNLNLKQRNVHFNTVWKFSDLILKTNVISLFLYLWFTCYNFCTKLIIGTTVLITRQPITRHLPLKT